MEGGLPWKTNAALPNEKRITQPLSHVILIYVWRELCLDCGIIHTPFSVKQFLLTTFKVVIACLFFRFVGIALLVFSFNVILHNVTSHIF